MNNTVAIVLAAGKGTRMKSDLPKVLAKVNDRPMIKFVLDTLKSAGINRTIVVVGYRAQDVKDSLQEYDVEYADQTEQLGTGHAVMVCRDLITDHNGPVVIVTGDSPLLQRCSVEQLLDEFAKSKPACLLGTLIHTDPSGLGRIVRNETGEFVGIVEEKDANQQQKAINEVNMSTYVFDCQALLDVLGELRDDNRQKEYYITDAPGILIEKGFDVRALPALKPCEALSVNTEEQLALVEAEINRLKAACTN
jgi:bifunctional UDP-N-acetylglucosamine pyrophosphorylase / glucosamine-1-phosphate N-acetyltransferase